MWVKEEIHYLFHNLFLCTMFCSTSIDRRVNLWEIIPHLWQNWVEELVCHQTSLQLKIKPFSEERWRSLKARVMFTESLLIMRVAMLSVVQRMWMCQIVNSYFFIKAVKVIIQDSKRWFEKKDQFSICWSKFRAYSMQKSWFLWILLSPLN